MPAPSSIPPAPEAEPGFDPVATVKLIDQGDESMLATVVLYAQAAFFAFTSAYSFGQPRQFAATLGLETCGAGGECEVRAQYAGFYGIAALVQGAAALSWIRPELGLMLGAVIFAGLTAGRLAGTLINRGITGYTPTLKALVFIDALGLATSVAALA